jgi:hypothetical protein
VAFVPLDFQRRPIEWLHQRFHQPGSTSETPHRRLQIRAIHRPNLSNHPPTIEQQTVLTAVDAGGTLKVKAYAGAGKTSTLTMIASRKRGQRGRYLAFNKEIAQSAKRKFPPDSVSASTWHSLAYSQVDSWLTNKLNAPKEPPHELASRFGQGKMRVPSTLGKTVEISAFQIGCMIAGGVGRFCRSAQPDPLAWHIPVDDVIERAAADEIREMLLPAVRRCWEEYLSRTNNVGISPDVYLKVWELSKPTIRADYILFDEVQDSDGLMLSVLRRQRHAQVIYVGDPYQQIYEWRGAVNAMGHIKAEEHALTESFRFGPAFATLASMVLKLLDEDKPVRGQSNINSVLVEDPSIQPTVDAILCRKNATVMGELAKGLEAGHRVAVRANVSEILAFAEGADRLMRGQRAWRPTSLALFESWKDVQTYAESFAGRDLFPIVNLIDQQGTGYLRGLLERISPEENADYVISTIHRAKGLEWNRVRVTGDFRFKDDEGRVTMTDEEKRLLYVGLTRARDLMDVSELKPDLMKLFSSNTKGSN